MKIRETIERECCDPRRDLRKYRGMKLDNASDNRTRLQFCMYCGQLWDTEFRYNGVDSEGVEQRVMPGPTIHGPDGMRRYEPDPKPIVEG